MARGRRLGNSAARLGQVAAIGGEGLRCKAAAGSERVDEAEKVHPAEPHRHLAYIGTRKGHEGKGFGSALVRSMLERCDADGMPTYLESTNPANDAW